jgi:error-prone DNA polymerase
MASARDLPAYAELHCLSNFSFQRGASRPEELVERAADLGYSALAITDECSMAGVVRAHVEAKARGLHLVVGTEVKVQMPGSTAGYFTLVLLARNRAGYGELCQLITAARADRHKGRYELRSDAWPAHSMRDLLALLVPRQDTGDEHGAHFESIFRAALWVRSIFPQRCWLAVELLRHMDDALWHHKLAEVGRLSDVPLVAAGNVHMHARSRKPLQDVVTSVRVGKPVAECGFELHPNAEAHLRSRMRLANIYPLHLLQEAARIAALCTFTLDDLKYEYPQEVYPDGDTPTAFLRRSTYYGAGERYPQGVPAKVQEMLEHELALIEELNYEKYFLTVYDIVRFARSRQILCQGRGSAANSAVCYCLGITEVDPSRMSMLFERFISRSRDEPPDIDVDFEHQRREEVIQYLYQKYGRDRAALVATVQTYRPRSAIRDVGKALGIAPELLDSFAKDHQWWDGGDVQAQRLRAVGLDPDARPVQLLIELTSQLLGFPRQLGTHTGGFVLTGDLLTSTVPVIHAAMEGRTTIEWDKDDIDALGLLKVDVLALGMLSAIRRALDLVGQWRGERMQMQDIPSEDPVTYDMICKADTIGVFQIESRAQMSMLPRMRPRRFYDLVIEVAIVRPGPIQGGMVHPYLQRRQGFEPVHYPSDALREALERTLGVPIFQEQVMQVAILAAGFSPDEADQLRRAMAAWRRKGGIERFYDRVVQGMVDRGYQLDFAQAIFAQIQGFGEYGFPESHAASFALLVYASCWLKCHEPACFLAAMLNSQPMGFYGPSQLVQDAQRHGVEVRPVDVMESKWDCTLETGNTEQPAVRLGLRMISGFRETRAEQILRARHDAPFDSAEDLALRAELDAGDLKLLAGADALLSLSGHRRQQVWDASGLVRAPALLKEAPVNEDILELPPAPEGEEVVFDYSALGLSLRSHPLALLRVQLQPYRVKTSAQLRDLPDGKLARACGLVTVRQQPATANGVVFVTLEDETGVVNVIVWTSVRDRLREPLLRAKLMAVYGTWQCKGEVRHLIAQHLVDLSPMLGGLSMSSRDFR